MSDASNDMRLVAAIAAAVLIVFWFLRSKSWLPRTFRHCIYMALSIWFRWLALHACCLYLLESADFIPDEPITGYLDDFIVATLALALFSRKKPKVVEARKAPVIAAEATLERPSPPREIADARFL